MAKAIARLQKQYEAFPDAPPPDFDARAFYERTLSELTERGSLVGLPSRLRRHLPWVYFLSFDDGLSLGQDPRKLDALIQLLHTHRRPRSVVSLLHNVLLYYPTDWKTWQQLRKGTKKLLGHKSPRVELWRNRNEKFKYLEPRGPEDFARIALGDGKPLLDVLKEASLVDQLEAGRFVQECYLRMLVLLHDSLKPAVKASDLLPRLLAFSEDSEGLRFEFHRGPLANALLEPFADSDPHPETRELIESFLHRHYGHPAVKPQNWHTVSQPARSVMLRWHVSATLDDFFLMVDQAAGWDGSGGFRWDYRKAFWRAYHKAGHIREAWIALGSNALGMVRRSRQSRIQAYGELSGGAPGDCMLLIKIAGITISEWSDTGTCRIYTQGNETTPKLYLNHYIKSDVVHSSPNDSIIHLGSIHYEWQGRVMKSIKDLTGATITSASYRVKGSK